MNSFDRANQALRQDMQAYARALREIVTVLPQALALCDRVVKEVTLARALLAFASGQQMADLDQLAFHLTNLWPYRERPFARTSGFGDEIAEAQRQRKEAQRGIDLLARQHGDPMAAELITCFTFIAQYLEEEQQQLEECHALIVPHAAKMDLTRKRLNLLVATVDARIPASLEKQVMLNAYNEAAAVLQDWQNGVPMEERGVEILDRCLEMLAQANQLAIGSELIQA